MRKVLLGFPCHTGTMPVEVSMSIYAEMMDCIRNGISVEPLFYPKCSLIELARNHILSQFYYGDYDDLIFWDVDQTCEAGSILKLLSHDVDIVGGAARIKKQEEEYRVDWLESETGAIMKENGIVEVSGIGACFMRITKKAAATIISENPDTEYADATTGGAAWRIFHTEVRDKKFWGEDMGFCRLARQAGFKIYLDPTIYFTHIGLHGYSGCMEDWLKENTLPKERPELQHKELRVA